MDPIQSLLDLLADDEQIAQLSDDEVAFLHAESVDLFNAIRNGEIEEIRADDVEVLTQVRDAAHAFEYLAAIREAEAAELDAQLADLEASLASTPPAEDPTIEDETEVEGEPAAAEVETDAAGDADETEASTEVEVLEPVVASTPAPAARPALSTARQHSPARTRPRPAPAAPAGYQAHLTRSVGRQVASSEDEFFQMFTEDFNDQFRTHGPDGQKLKLARIRGDFPDELTLGSSKTNQTDQEIIDAIVQPMSRLSYWTPELQARVATGGFCAPSEIDYAYEGVGSAERPVHDSLAPFNAARGGLQTPAPLVLSSITTSSANPPTSTAAVSQYTEAMDIAGTVTKPKQRIACGTMRESRLYAVTERFIFGNFGQRAWPELIAETIRLGGVAHARFAETLMLDRMKALADEQLEVDRTFGAARDLAEGVARAAEAWRNRNRDYSVALHAWMPRWVPTMGFVDLMRGDQIEAARATLEATFRSWLSGAGVNVTFYDDSPTSGVTQLFPAEVSGTLLNPWPTSVQWCLAEEGHYLALTQADLDLGIYRDSALVDHNDAEMFLETFESVHKRGVLSQWITSKVCVDGSWSDGIDGSTVMGCAS